MPSSYSDQFYDIDPGNPPPTGTVLGVQNHAYSDQDDDGYIETGTGDTVDGVEVTRVWVDDTVSVVVPGEGRMTITGVTFYTADGRALFTPSDGTELPDGARFISSTYVTTPSQIAVADLNPSCFAAGTMIGTPEGPRAIETLRRGDLVSTLDHGAQPVLMVSRERFAARGRNAPVRIARGALGNDADLLVSQQHRMLIGGWRAELYCGTDEVLVPAKHLVNGAGIAIEEGGEVEYFHLLFAGHEIVWGAGIPSESFFPGECLSRADRAVRAELERLFPGIVAQAQALMHCARPVPRRFESRMLTG